MGRAARPSVQSGRPREHSALSIASANIRYGPPCNIRRPKVLPCDICIGGESAGVPTPDGRRVPHRRRCSCPHLGAYLCSVEANESSSLRYGFTTVPLLSRCLGVGGSFAAAWLSVSRSSLLLLFLCLDIQSGQSQSVRSAPDYCLSHFELR